LIWIALTTFALIGEPSAMAEDYRLGVGDTVQILVYGEPELSRTVTITQTCRADMHLLGPVEVCGFTPSKVAQDIQERLADGYLVRPQVVVDIQTYGSQLIEIKGEIKEPGMQVLRGPTTLSQAITNGGGPASPNVYEVEVISANDEITTYYLPNLDKRPDPVWIQPGDIVVLRPPLNVYVQGEVKTEGPVAYRDGLQVTEALSLAGGPSEYASLRRAYILRSDGDKVRANIRRITRGEAEDISLSPNDRLVIRRSFF